MHSPPQTMHCLPAPNHYMILCTRDCKSCLWTCVNKSLCSHPLFFFSPYMFNKHHSISIPAISPTWWNSMAHLCFIHTSMSDTILSHCPSAAISCMATKCGIMVGRFNLYWSFTNLWLTDFGNKTCTFIPVKDCLFEYNLVSLTLTLKKISRMKRQTCWVRCLRFANGEK